MFQKLIVHQIDRDISTTVEVLMQKHLSELAVGYSMDSKGLVALIPKIVRRLPQF